MSLLTILVLSSLLLTSIVASYEVQDTNLVQPPPILDDGKVFQVESQELAEPKPYVSKKFLYVPKQSEPPRIVVVRKLYKDPVECHQMTWDLYGIKPSKCRGPSCFRPYFSGPVQPDPTTNGTRFCNMLKSESCIKYVIYDQYDKKQPIFISRYCDRIYDNEGGSITDSCHRINNVEICVCRDKNKCNAGSHLKSNFALVSSILVLISYLYIQL